MISLEKLVRSVGYLAQNIKVGELNSPLVEYLQDEGPNEIAHLTSKGIRRAELDMGVPNGTIRDFDERFHRYSTRNRSNENNFSRLLERLYRAQNSGLTSEIASEFDSRYNAENILWLHAERGKSPDFANSYDSKFDFFSVEALVESDINPDTANSYDDRLKDGRGVLILHKAGIDSDSALKFDSRFSVPEIGHLHREDFSPEDANVYRLGNSGTLAGFKKFNISAEIANDYDDRFFRDGAIEKFVQAEVDAKTVNGYDSRFTANDIVEFHNIGIPSEQANKFDRRYHRGHISQFKELEVDAEEANLYLSVVNEGEALQLAKEGLKAQDAIKYKEDQPIYEGYSADDIIAIRGGNFSVEEASKLRDVVTDHLRQKRVGVSDYVAVTGVKEEMLRWADINMTFDTALKADQIQSFYSNGISIDDVRQTMKSNMIIDTMKST